MNAILVTVIALVIVGVFNYNLNIKKPDVRYTLSENIPISLSGTTETIQQLEVKNLGNEEAKQNSVIIKGLVTSYDLVKYSQSDKVENFDKDHSLEVVYLSLPPEGSFKIVIKSTDQGISKNSVTVNHSKGKATEVFSNNNPNQSWFIYLFYTLMAVLVVLLFVEGRSIAIISLKNRATYDYISILSGKIPFYLGNEKWQDIREKALDAQVIALDSRFYTFEDIENHPAYKTLSYEKPKYLDNKQWDKLCKSANEILGKIITTRITEAFLTHYLNAVFNLKKPPHFDILKWKEIQKNGWSKYVILKKQHLYDVLEQISPHKLKTEIESPRPDSIPDENWSEYRRFLKQHCYNYLTNEIYVNDNASMVLSSNQQFIKMLDEHYMDTLKFRAYRKDLASISTVDCLYSAKEFLKTPKPEWIQDKDYEQRLKNANAFLELETLTNTYNTKYDLLSRILLAKPIPSDMPQNLKQDEWKDLLHLEGNVKHFRQNMSDNEQKVSNLAKLELQTIELRDILRYKLTVLDNFLLDPTTLDKIEKEDLFALGNLNNLRTLAKLMDKHRTA